MSSDLVVTSTLRRLGAELAVGAVAGFAASSLGGPAVISWWYEPPSRDAFSCAGSVKTALSQFVTMQLSCAVIGSITTIGVVFVIRRALQNRKERKVSAQPT